MASMLCSIAVELAKVMLMHALWIAILMTVICANKLFF
jgi:hypothetical protein